MTDVIAILCVLNAFLVWYGLARASYWKLRCKATQARLDTANQLKDAWKERAEVAECRLKESLEFQGAIRGFRDYGALNDEEIL